MTSLRDSLKEICPPWLLDFVGERIGYAIAVVLDASGDRLREGIMSRFPGHGPEGALPFIGNDRQIDRGPNEPASSYVPRLRTHLDAWRVAGSAHGLLEQLRFYFSPTFIPMRFVTNRAMWHEIDPTSAVTTKTKVAPSNWIWDSRVTARWWYAWPILDSSAGPWTIDLWGEAGDWGDGGVWGSDATPSEIEGVRRIMRKWKPANVYYPAPIITFDGAFQVADTAADNFNGNGESSIYRASLLANFLDEVRT